MVAPAEELAPPGVGEVAVDAGGADAGARAGASAVVGAVAVVAATSSLPPPPPHPVSACDAIAAATISAFLFSSSFMPIGSLPSALLIFDIGACVAAGETLGSAPSAELGSEAKARIAAQANRRDASFGNWATKK